MVLSMKILVTGSRHWTDRKTIERELKKYSFTNPLLPPFKQPPILFHGACEGADTIAGEIGKSLGWKVDPHPAHWDILGLAAGPSRNQHMVDHDPDICLAFHSDLGKSAGTADCVRRARSVGIPVTVVKSRR